MSFSCFDYARAKTSIEITAMACQLHDRIHITVFKLNSVRIGYTHRLKRTEQNSDKK